MTNKEVRNLLAITAENKQGKTRQELGYKCEETCAEGATAVLQEVAEVYKIEGLSVGSISCNDMYKNMTQSPYWYEPNDWMTRGDYIFFDWDRLDDSRPLDHVGICLKVEGDTMTYANINGSSHNSWTIQTINKNNCNIAYWLRYLNPVTSGNLSVTNETLRENAHTIVENEEVYNKIHRLQELRIELDVLIQDLFNIVCKK